MCNNYIITQAVDVLMASAERKMAIELHLVVNKKLITCHIIIGTLFGLAGYVWIRAFPVLFEIETLRFV